MSDGSLTPERFEIERSEASQKFDVVQSTENTLLLDLDTKAARDQFNRVFPKVREHYSVSCLRTWRSKSGNTHREVVLRVDLPFTYRVALQAALGSDGVKEALSLQRYRNGCVEPSMLFRPKDAVITEVTVF